MEPEFLRSETERNPLKIQDCDEIRNTSLLGERSIQQLRKNRQNAAPRLAKHAAPFTQKKLLDLAAEYDAGIAKLEPRPSEATRNLRKETRGVELTPQ
jgi:hypothetical protein